MPVAELTEVEEALEELFENSFEVTGEDQKIIVQGKEISTLYTPIGADLAPVIGGESDRTSYKFIIRRREAPEKIDTSKKIKFGDLDLDIFQWEVMAGGAGVEIVAGNITEDFTS